MLCFREDTGEVGYSASVHTDVVLKAEQRVMLHLWGNLRLRGKTQGISTVLGVDSRPSYLYNAANPVRLTWSRACKFCDTLQREI